MSLVLFHLYITDDCNLSCRYCRGGMFETIDGNDPCCEVSYDLPPDFDSALLPSLYSFLKKDPDPVLTFIGGEPLLKTDLICRIMDHIPRGRFMLQTNGLLLDRLPAEYRNRFETILISIDGDEATTDQNRGDGVYSSIITIARGIRREGFGHEIIARMTIDEETDIAASVLHLQNLKDSPFTSIHWQINANFNSDYSKRHFSDWVLNSYNPGISELIQYWVDHMYSHAEVLAWYPFLQTTLDLLVHNNTGLRCGSGSSNYTIQADGSVVPCPIMIGLKDTVVGDIRSNDPFDLPKVVPGPPCTDCAIIDFCGGRCLYSNLIRPWPEEGIRAVCSTVHHLRSSLVAHLPAIQGLIDDQTITLSSFAHTRYNGCEIIP